MKDLRQLYKEAQEDILLLREKLARQKPADKSLDSDEDLSARQDLIMQLEQSQEKVGLKFYF